MDIKDLITVIRPIIEDTAETYREAGTPVDFHDGYVQALYDIENLLTAEVPIASYVRGRLQDYADAVEDRLMRGAPDLPEELTEPIAPQDISPQPYRPE